MNGESLIGIVVVTHSQKLAEGIKELAEQMVRGKVPIACAGGVSDVIGTDATLIKRAIDEVYSEDGVLVLVDFGSAVLSSKVAITLIESEKADKILIADAPLVEGTFVAAVEASIGKSLLEVKKAAEDSKNLKKV